MLMNVAESKDDSEIDVSTDSEFDWDIDWDEWSFFGSTDTYLSFESNKCAEYTGKVEFTNSVRKSSSDNRIGARSKVRMEPGRQLCNDGLDDYCCDGNALYTGWRNKGATVYHNWDQALNEIDTSDLIQGTDPEGQIEDISRTRGAQIGVGLSSNPSLTIGYSSSVSMSGAELIDATSKASGYSEHQLDIDPEAHSATNNAVFEVGSVSAWDWDCSDWHDPLGMTALEIDVELEWGVQLFGNWQGSQSDEHSFTYLTCF
ncbi:hypothetical protein [Natronobeatus ordinarius]|uniref:hypothetical protein n=1 Tax=Natronobeatus ordinarius TaxID=2963433 RepID=UPI0020CE99A2|nr:hypothetical protein [Natronobeatus ordinarius]